MAVLQYKTLSNRTVAALSVERDTVFWDRDLTGFGVRKSSGAKTYCQYYHNLMIIRPNSRHLRAMQVGTVPVRFFP